MLTLVANVSLQDVVDAFLRAKTGELGQTEMAKRIATQRQGVNAIMNRREGRRFTMEHLERFATSSGIMMSTLLAELAKLAWERETELGASPPTFSPPVDKPSPPPNSVAELADLLNELLEERRRRR
jgi:hypothetical protein